MFYCFELAVSIHERKEWVVGDRATTNYGWFYLSVVGVPFDLRVLGPSQLSSNNIASICFKIRVPSVIDPR